MSENNACMQSENLAFISPTGATGAENNHTCLRAMDPPSGPPRRVSTISHLIEGTAEPGDVDEEDSARSSSFTCAPSW